MEFTQFWTRETFANIRRNRLMSLLAISTVTVALFILGAFYLTLSNLRAVVGNEAKKLDLVVILDRGISPARRRAIFEAARIPQVGKVEIKMASEALKEFKKLFADLPLDDIEKDNPLGDQLSVHLKNPDDYFKVRAYLGTIRGVSAIQDSEADLAARRLLKINSFLTKAAIVSLFVLGLAILLIIHNVIRLTVFARRREIRIMRLVGATPGFIRVPFLLEGSIYGISGAVLAALGLAALYSAPIVRSFLPLSPGEILGPCAALLLTAGLVFGVLGAGLSFSHSQRGLGG